MKGKKLLAGILSAAMCLSTMVIPAFAENNANTAMTYGEFLTAVVDSNYNFDGSGVTVTLKTNYGCSNSGHTTSCETGYSAATAETPDRIDLKMYRAQYQPFKNYDGDITIKNVNFVADITEGTGRCALGYSGEFAKGTDFYVEFQFETKGNLTIDNCSFDNICVAPYHTWTDADKAYTDTITNCEFKNVYNTYGIATVNGGTAVIKNNTFNNCSGGVYIQNGGTNGVLIENNEFSDMGSNGLAEKKDSRGLVQISAGVPSEAVVTMINNTSDNSTPAIRNLRESGDVYTIGNRNFETETTDSKQTATEAVVATIGAKGYTSLHAALSACKANETVVLQNDVADLTTEISIKRNLDLNGHTLYVPSGTSMGNSIEAGVTVSNGTISVTDKGDAGDAVFCICHQSNGTVRFEDVNIYAKKVRSGCGLFHIDLGGNLEFIGGGITYGINTAEETPNTADSIFIGVDGTSKLTIKGTAAKKLQINVARAEKLFNLLELDAEYVAFEGLIEQDLFAVITNGKVKNSTFTYKNAGEKSRALVNDKGVDYAVTKIDFENTQFIDVPEFKKEGGTFVFENASTTVSADENTTITKAEGVAAQPDFGAKIGTTKYATLEAALKAAKENDTITLLADATINGGFRNKDAVMTLDLNDKTLTVDCGTRTDCYFRKMTFKNGNIKVIGESSTAAFFAWYQDDYLVFDNVKIDANEFKGTYLIANDYTNTNSRIEIINGTEIYYNSDEEKELSTVIHFNSSGTLKIDNSKINVANTDGHIINNNGGDVVISGNSEITGTNVGTSGIFNINGKSLTIKDNAVVTITDVKGSTEWNPEKAGIVLGADTPYTVEDTATVKNADVYRKPSEKNLTNTVKVSFTDVTENEGEAVYDIYVEAEDEKTINRLTAVQMEMNLTTEADFEMTVTAADGVTRSFENGMYLFNFDGETKPSATGAKIKIGQVKFVGYGKFSLAVTDGQAHATTLDGENVVTDFVKEPAEGQGTFDCGTGIEDAEVVRPTRKLTINIDFNNDVKSQKAAYTDMAVTVSGTKFNKTYKLGNDGEADIIAIDGNKAVIEIKDSLIKGLNYTVEITGAGYRTARHTVTMTEDKTLNFWNNVKDNAVYVEEGKGTATQTTFLAGEIVKDGKINIYDLSAVVSYFGTSTNVDEKSEYAKYDLNRDGKIDSKDVAYVLASWGK